jgi:hypothetical protein
MKEPDKPKSDKHHRKYEKPISLATLTFTQTVRKIVKAKPPARKPKKKS